MRLITDNPRRNWLGLRFFAALFLILIISLLKVTDVARSAAGDVTLTASGFSDDDAEDTFNASQWVVRDSSTTVYDQVAGAVTSVTIPAATFSNGTTYFWKVRYQDQHLVWGDYSAESSFVYGTASTPTPTPGASTQPENSPIVSVVPSGTATSTVTATPSKTPNPSPSPAPTWSCMFGWFLWNGEWSCGDPQPLESSILVNEDLSDFCPGDMVKVTYYWMHDNSFSGGLTGPESLDDYTELMQGSDAPVHDVYLSTDGGSVYKRIEHDFDPMPGAVMEYLPSQDKGRAYPFNGARRLKVTHYVNIPEGTVSDPSKAKILVRIAHNRSPVNYGALPEGTMYMDEGGQDAGNSFLLGSLSNDFWLGADVMDFTNSVTAGSCQNVSPTISPVDNECKSTITSPKTWVKGSSNRIAWASGFQSQTNDVKTANIIVEKSGGQSEPIVMNQVDTGSYETTYNPGSDKTVNLRLEQYLSGKLASSCLVSLKVSSGGGGCTGPGCVAEKLSTILVLGSLLATALSLLLTALSGAPDLARVLSGLFNLMSAPVWPAAGWTSGRHAWGVVYDTSTKTPIEKAVIRVFSEPSDRLRATIRTNKNGQFGFILPPGLYSLTASSSGFDFPSRLINTQTDGPYTNLYKGGSFKIDGDGTQKAQVNFNVPLDRVKVSTFDLIELKTLTSVSRFFQAIRFPLMILGTLSTGYLVFTQGRVIDYILAVVYVAMWTWEIRNAIRKKAFGVVKDQQGNPIALCVIRVLDRTNRIRTTIVTGEDGKFQANLDAGEYRFDISRPGYRSVRTELIKVSSIQDLGKLDINLIKL